MKFPPPTPPQNFFSIKLCFFSGFTVRTGKCNEVSLPPHTQTHQRGHTFGLHPVKNTHSLRDKADILPLQIRSGPHKNFKAHILSDCYRTCRTDSPALMQLVCKTVQTQLSAKHSERSPAYIIQESVDKNTPRR